MPYCFPNVLTKKKNEKRKEREIKTVKGCMRKIKDNTHCRCGWKSSLSQVFTLQGWFKKFVALI